MSDRRKALHDLIEKAREEDLCRVNTFLVENQEIITFDETNISDSGSEVIYKLRVLTANAESEISLNVPV